MHAAAAAIFSCLLVAQLALSAPSPYQIYNYTWVIENQAGDIVNSTTFIGASPHWPDLRADLCQLALGAGQDWGTPDLVMPLQQALNNILQGLGLDVAVIPKGQSWPSCGVEFMPAPGTQAQNLKLQMWLGQ